MENEKLKTLKEIEREVHKNWHPKNKLGAYNDEKCTEDNCPITDILGKVRAEAIKWAKAIREKEKVLKIGMASYYDPFSKFFNLAEEELGE